MQGPHPALLVSQMLNIDGIGNTGQKQEDMHLYVAPMQHAAAEVPLFEPIFRLASNIAPIACSFQELTQRLLDSCLNWTGNVLGMSGNVLLGSHSCLKAPKLR